MTAKRYTRKFFAAALALSVMMGGMAAVSVSAAEQVSGTAASVVAAVPNSSSVSASRITLGQSITVKGASELNGCTYAYFYKKAADTKWTTKKNFSSTTSVTLTPATATTYNICVKVKDAGGSVYKKYFDIPVDTALVNDSSISSDSITKGQKVTMTGAASGGSGDYTYAFFCKKAADSKWMTKQDFSSNASVAFTPAAATDYDICIKIKDSNGAVAKKYLKLAVKLLVNNSSVSETEIEKGNSVILKGVASGGNGSCQYAYFVKKPNSSSWTTLKNFSTVKSVRFTPDNVGEYQLCIKVKDATGAVVKQYFDLSVIKPFNPATEIVESIIDNSMTEIQKVKAIHDWLVNNVEYDIENYNNGTIPDTSYTAEGLFATHKAVCDGYSKAFVKMAECAGLDSLRVTGTGNGGPHAWNQVKVDGKWYNIDVTWDDPVVSGEALFDNLSYDYFLIPDSVIQKDHIFDKDIFRQNCITPQPFDKLIDEVLADDINSHKYWYYCENTNDVQKAARAASGDGMKTFTLIYPKNSMNDNEIMMAACRAAGYYGASCEYMDWKFDGYQQMIIYFS